MTNLTQPTTTLTDEELADLKAQISFEEQRRLRVERIPEQIKALNLQYLEDTDDGEWHEPTGLHNAYPKNYMVMHEGKLYISIVDANVRYITEAEAWEDTAFPETEI
jgi:hypothetical protein